MVPNQIQPQRACMEGDMEGVSSRRRDETPSIYTALAFLIMTHEQLAYYGVFVAFVLITAHNCIQGNLLIHTSLVALFSTAIKGRAGRFF